MGGADELNGRSRRISIGDIGAAIVKRLDETKQAELLAASEERQARIASKSVSLLDTGAASASTLSTGEERAKKIVLGAKKAFDRYAERSADGRVGMEDFLGSPSKREEFKPTWHDDRRSEVPVSTGEGRMRFPEFLRALEPQTWSMWGHKVEEWTAARSACGSAVTDEAAAVDKARTALGSEARQQLSTLFKAYGESKGKLSCRKLLRAFTDSCGLEVEDLTRQLAMWDEDGDGMLDFEGFVGFMLSSGAWEPEDRKS